MTQKHKYLIVPGTDKAVKNPVTGLSYDGYRIESSIESGTKGQDTKINYDIYRDDNDGKKVGTISSRFGHHDVNIHDNHDERTYGDASAVMDITNAISYRVGGYIHEVHGIPEHMRDEYMLAALPQEYGIGPQEGTRLVNATYFVKVEDYDRNQNPENYDIWPHQAEYPNQLMIGIASNNLNTELCSGETLLVADSNFDTSPHGRGFDPIVTVRTDRSIENTTLVINGPDADIMLSPLSGSREGDAVKEIKSPNIVSAEGHPLRNIALYLDNGYGVNHKQAPERIDFSELKTPVKHLEFGFSALDFSEKEITAFMRNTVATISPENDEATLNNDVFRKVVGDKALAKDDKLTVGRAKELMKERGLLRESSSPSLEQ